MAVRQRSHRSETRMVRGKTGPFPQFLSPYRSANDTPEYYLFPLPPRVSRDNTTHKPTFERKRHIILQSAQHPGSRRQGDTYARQDLREARRGDRQARGEYQGLQIADGRSGGGEASRAEQDLDQLSESWVRDLVAQSPFLFVLIRLGLLFLLRA